MLKEILEINLFFWKGVFRVSLGAERAESYQERGIGELSRSGEQKETAVAEVRESERLIN